MNYRKFRIQLMDALEAQIHPEAVVRLSRIWKPNQAPMESLNILYPGDHVAPAIYTEIYYEKYLAGMEMEEIVDEILAFHYENRRGLSFDPEKYLDVRRVRENIICRLVNTQKNRQMLQQVPHREFMDLSVIYYYRIEDPAVGKANMLIQNAHMSRWKITPDRLHELAAENTRRILPWEMKSVSEMAEEMMKEESMEEESIEEKSIEELVYCDTDSISMYVLTNTERCCGAVSIIFPEVLEAVSRRIGGDFYVLPSSIHECMIVPVRGNNGMTPERYREMVIEINASQVAEEELLGDSVYRYFSREKQLRIAAGRTEG